jgi:purine-binding chemotaxis protein CheW
MMSDSFPAGADRRSERLRLGTLGLLVFAVDGHRLALELDAVERVVSMVAIAPLAGAPDAVLGAVDVAGEVVPVYDVRRRLELAPRDYGADAVLLLARTARRRVALAADEVAGVREIGDAPVTAADELPPGTRHAAGAVAVEDGLVVIHDLEAFLSEEEERRLARALAEAAGGVR